MLDESKLRCSVKHTYIPPLSGYETLDSGERAEYESGMIRDTQAGKPDFSLMFPDLPYEEQPLTRFAMLMTRGAEKYGRRNWQMACSEEELERFKSSAFRHFIQWLTGEEDEDHMSAVMFNLVACEHTKHMMNKPIGKPENGETKCLYRWGVYDPETETWFASDTLMETEEEVRADYLWCTSFVRMDDTKIEVMK